MARQGLLRKALQKAEDQMLREQQIVRTQGLPAFMEYLGGGRTAVEERGRVMNEIRETGLRKIEKRRKRMLSKHVEGKYLASFNLPARLAELETPATYLEGVAQRFPNRNCCKKLNCATAVLTVGISSL